MELLLIFTIYCELAFAAALVFLAMLGILLLMDFVLNTHVGRRVCRKIFFDK